MPAPDRIGRESPLSVRDWLARAGLSVALAAVLGTVQVAVLWSQGLFHGAPEAIAESPPPSLASCSNCGWWPWQDPCDWTKVREVRGTAYSDKRPHKYSIWCVKPEEPPKSFECECSLDIGTKMYKWLPGIKVGLLPDWGYLKSLGLQVEAEWDLSSTVTQGSKVSHGFSIAPGTCGPDLYCYKSREYVQSLYRQRLGVKGSSSGGYYNGGWGNTASSPPPSYTFVVCDSPCSGDATLFEGPPTPMLAPSELPDYVGPLQSACQQ